MQWSPEAEAAISKVPFFVRGKVRRRVESEAAAAGRKTTVDLADVRATQQRYLKRMADEIKGYQLDTCFGPGGCPNRSVDTGVLVEKLEDLLRAADLLTFLRQAVGRDLKFHHEFRVAVAECPNACSQPQIKDIGIVGARRPVSTGVPCTVCGACREVCPDRAVTPGQEEASPPLIDHRDCMACGKCIDVCPTGSIVEGRQGYRVLLGGKLGRHPQLAAELPGIYGQQGVLRIVGDCVEFYKRFGGGGKRFSEILTPADFQKMTARRAEFAPENQREESQT